MPASRLIAGTKNFCPGTRMTRPYKFQLFFSSVIHYISSATFSIVLPKAGIIAPFRNQRQHHGSRTTQLPLQSAAGFKSAQRRIAEVSLTSIPSRTA